MQGLQGLQGILAGLANGGGAAALRNQILGFGQQAQPGTAIAAAPGTLSSAANEIRIVAEESTNSLMIRSSAQDFAVMQTLIQSIDLRPLQVLIEVTIAEVQRNQDLNVGISGGATRKKKGTTTDSSSVSFP